ncbi:5-oxoprolinase subunit PxpA [Acidaminococcus fermentans]|uniref:LamB/YcsF family protein n=1 Tax=Acidaminococcus fermentans TaxID=905 RepID=UPI0024329C9E|nr:5-oxoprolinase subunit PxpA [Acidaminococcus fermentans]
MKVVDMNSDLGESFGNYKLGMDDKILEIVTSANIACGFHAGDPSVMKKTVALAVKNGAALGAHPGYPDLVGFGRRKMDIAPSDVYNMVVYQVGALAAFAKAVGTRLQHVKPHGAMYNMAAKDAKLAEAIAQAVYDVDKDLILYAQGGTESIKAAEKIGLRTASEVFADRSYQDDGTLTPRSQPGAMITDEEKSIAQVPSMVLEGKVTALSGKVIPVKADSICLHGDGPKALVFANKIRSVLLENGVKVAASGTFIK